MSALLTLDQIPEDKRHQYSEIVLQLFNQPSTVVVADLDLHDPIICYLYGLYHSKVDKDYDQMKAYYLKAIELDHVESMFNLGHHYETVERNYSMMKREQLRHL